MAEDSDLERSEPASPKRLQEARDRGQIPRSPELATFAVLLAGASALFMFGRGFIQALESVMANGLSLDRAAAFESPRMLARLWESAEFVLGSFAGYLALLFVAALLAPLVVSGWIFTFEAVAPQFSRINPASGFKRIFSAYGAVELVKAIAKSLVVGGIATWVMVSEIGPILGLAGEPSRSAIAHLGELLAFAFLAVVAAMALIVVVDVPFQIWEHRRQLRMTKEEVRQEYKETEGDPQIKARIRQLQREQARRRMMSEVPKADVVVTNPTHYAVALRYRENAMRAPTIVALGSAQVAERIVALARENAVPVVRAAPLARALHAHGELQREIPAALYTAVAEVLAYVYQLARYRNTGGDEPLFPANLSVPPEYDPELGEEAP